MNWIRIKDQLPPCDGNRKNAFCIALHTIHGVGVAWFWNFRKSDEDYVKELEEDYEDTYLCSYHFIKNRLDEDYCIDEEDDIDIFTNSPEFINLGTVTHWMPLPIPTPCECSSQPNHEDHESLGSFHRRALSGVLHFPKE